MGCPPNPEEKDMANAVWRRDELKEKLLKVDEQLSLRLEAVWELRQKLSGQLSEAWHERFEALEQVFVHFNRNESSEFNFKYSFEGFEDLSHIYSEVSLMHREADFIEALLRQREAELARVEKMVGQLEELAGGG